MSNEKHYPLHPSHAESMYMQISRDAFDSMSAELEELRKLVVPTDLLKAEIDSLKREIDMYKSITQGDKTTIDDVVEINTLTSEVKALREINAKAQEEIATLKENQRWRKFPDEKPSEEMEGEDFIVSNGFYAVICEWRGYWNNEPFMGDKNCDSVKYWMQSPKAPRDK